MLSRARVLATVTLLIGCLAGPAAWAQNLEAGKSASQLFAGTCSACHKSPRGMLKTVSPGALTGFLREHYTTSGDMASQLSAYLVSNGAGDNSRQTRQGADAKPGPAGDQQGRRQHGTAGQETARPDADATSREAGPSGRGRQARPVEAPEEGKPTPNGPGQAAIERGPDGRKLKRLGRRGRPEELPAGSEPPKAESGPGMNDTAAGEVNSKPEVSKPGEAKPSDVKPAEATSEPAKSEPVKSEPAQAEPPKDMSTGEPRPDPVSAVTPAPSAASAPLPAAATDGSSAMPAPAASAPTPSAPAASASTAVPSPPAAVTPPPAPTAVTASAPPAAPSSSSGPPVPPISR